MGEALRKPGIRLAATRSTALFQLATELPAAVLACTLGIHITVAVAVKWRSEPPLGLGRLSADVSNRQTDVHIQEQRSSTDAAT
ncbi:hypothetical protein [Streptomyces sp. NRRL S-350]|uniref:hypothetical protein n=1 Tax=Streptomyces sp. NRRL S-350 TaxID=1463902 RepID=UPI0004BEC38F|nr:hypothetical protein [Streptomyces sp. NRRL S-350]